MKKPIFFIIFMLMTSVSYGNLTLTPGEGVDIVSVGGAGTDVTVSGENATDSNKGIASFDGTDFSVSTGAVTLGVSPTITGLFSSDSVTTTSGSTFATVNTGQGATEVYAMDQDVEQADAVTFATINTGQGANELYDMDQNVQTTDNVTFSDVIVDSISATGSSTFGDITIGTGSITASSGSISFGNESLVTTGNSSFGNVTSSGFIGDLTGDVTGNADTVTNGVYTTDDYYVKNSESDTIAGLLTATGGFITTASSTIDSDSSRLYLGDSQDASIYYDGTELNISTLGGSPISLMDGNVGIGTATPEQLLVVDTGSDAIGGYLGVRLGNDNRFIKIGNTGGDISHILVDDNDVIAFGQEDSFATDGSTTTELMRIEREGGTDRTLVGIGNNNPAYELDVVGDVNITEGLFVTLDATAGNYITTGNITIDSDTSRLYLGDAQDASIYSDGSDMWFFDGTTGWVSLATANSGTGGSGTDDQTIDVFSFDGTSISLSLEDDGEATKTLDISSVDTNTQLSQATVEDYAGGLFTGNTETLITATYQEADNTVDLVVDGDLSNYNNTTSAFIQATDVPANETDAAHDNCSEITDCVSNAQAGDATLTDIADGTIAENLVNTANPWADNEIASSATWNAKAPTASPTFTGTVTAPILTVSTSFYVDDDIPVYFGDDQDASIYFDSTEGGLAVDSQMGVYSTGSTEFLGNSVIFHTLDGTCSVLIMGDDNTVTGESITCP